MKSAKNSKAAKYFITFVSPVLAALFTVYFIVLQFMSPSNFWGTIFSFSMVWLLMGILFAALFIFRKKDYFSRIPAILKKIFAALMLIGFSAASVCLYFILTPRISNGSEEVKYVILLGGGITKDMKLTQAMQQRVKTASEYLKHHPNAKAVVTGGHLRFTKCSEASVLKTALVSHGIDKNRIIEEEKALDTIENFKYSAILLSQSENISISEVISSPVAVITSGFHLARAEYLAARIGFTNVYGVPASVPPVFVLNSYCREICAYIKLFFRVIFTGKPKPLAI